MNLRQLKTNSYFSFTQNEETVNKIICEYFRILGQYDPVGHADSPITGGPNSWVDRNVGSGPQGNTPSSQDSEKKSPAVSQ